MQQPSNRGQELVTRNRIVQSRDILSWKGPTVSHQVWFLALHRTTPRICPLCVTPQFGGYWQYLSLDKRTLKLPL